jgi:hypothetical protein
MWDLKLRRSDRYSCAPPLAAGYGIPAVRTGRSDELAVAAREVFGAAKVASDHRRRGARRFLGGSWAKAF